MIFLPHLSVIASNPSALGALLHFTWLTSHHVLAPPLLSASSPYRVSALLYLQVLPPAHRFTSLTFQQISNASSQRIASSLSAQDSRHYLSLSSSFTHHLTSCNLLSYFTSSSLRI
jgi:hypothetical protein